MNPAMTTRTPLTGPVVWSGDEIKNSTRWIRDLPASTASRARCRACRGQAKGLDWSQITRKDFPLSSLDGLLADIRDELENGSGILKLRGVPVARYDEDDLRKTLLRSRHPSRHARLPEPPRRADARHPRRRRRRRPHLRPDRGPNGWHDLPLVLCAHTHQWRPALPHRPHRRGRAAVRAPGARTGGVSMLCSSVAVLNEMLRRRPICSTCCSTEFRSRLGEEGTEESQDAGDRLPAADLRRARRPVHQPLSRCTYIEAAQMAPGCRSSPSSRTRPSTC